MMMRTMELRAIIKYKQRWGILVKFVKVTFSSLVQICILSLNREYGVSETPTTERAKTKSPTNASFLNPVFPSGAFHSTLLKHWHKHFLFTASPGLSSAVCDLYRTRMYKWVTTEKASNTHTLVKPSPVWSCPRSLLVYKHTFKLI